jgi:hypothetical protein
MKRALVMGILFIVFMSVGCEVKTFSEKPITNALAQARAMNGKFGYISTSGQWIIEPIFDGASAFSEGLASVKINEKWGYINNKGTFVINPKFSYAMPFSEGMAPVYIQNDNALEEWFIDTAGNERFRLHVEQGDWYGDFHEGLLRVCKAGKFGFLDKNGKVTIPFIYSYAEDLVNGYSIVGVDKKKTSQQRDFGVIDSAGSVIIPLQYYALSRIADGATLLAVTQNGQMTHLYNRTGKLIKTFNGRVYPNSYGYASVVEKREVPKELSTTTDDGRYYANFYNIIDQFGEVRFTKPYSSAYPRGTLFEIHDYVWNDLSKKYVNEMYFVNTEGQFKFSEREILNQLEWERIIVQDFISNNAIVRYSRLADPNNTKNIVEFIVSYAVINDTGKVVIPSTILDRAYFYQDETLVGYNSKAGAFAFVNKYGRVMMRKLNNSLPDYHCSLWAVNENGKWGYLDPTGRYAITPQFLWAGAFHSVE